jgi:hypothetical protein
MNFFVTGCTSSKKMGTDFSNTASPFDKLHRTAATIFQKHSRIFYNSDSTYALCFAESKPTASLPEHQVEFFIYELQGDSIMYQSSIKDGSVSWFNKYQVIVSTIPGIVSSEAQRNERIYGFLYDVKLKKTIPKGSTLQVPNKE